MTDIAQIMVIALIGLLLMAAGYTALGIKDDDTFRRKMIDLCIGLAIVLAVFIA